MGTGRLLQLISVGEVPSGVLESLVEPLKTYLGIEAQVQKKAMPHPKYAFNKDRDQYHTNAILKRLTPLLETPGEKMLGLCELDLFMPDAPFVFGEADREAKVAVLSTFRLKGTPEQSKRRLFVEGIHLAGHLVGLSYCEDARCVMYMAQAPAECDRKNLSPCSLCRSELARLLR